jgi:1,5-anhydro-D-fructose reductase (1,5-anhydro-D-mannitol-forming)
MTQSPKGEVLLRTAAGDEWLPIDRTNLYLRSVCAFQGAVLGNGQPSATGEDGVRSMALAIAALESAATGREVPIEAGI